MVQQQRPGELSRELILRLPLRDAAQIERRASRTGLPVGLWSTIAVEATRSIRLAQETLGISLRDLHGRLSAAAAEPGNAGRTSRLTDYAEALLAAAPRDAATITGAIALRPGLAASTAWQIEAEAARLPMDSWVLEAIGTAPEGFVPWEAAAAAEGRSLPEWALVQAARRCRSASTSAQIFG